jgi:hypothetical protein
MHDDCCKIPFSLKIYSPPVVGSIAVFHSKNRIRCDQQPLPRIRKAHTGSMRRHRAKSPANLGIRPNKVAPTAACNSLHYKTLPITPLAARLCRAHQGYLGPNSCICNILRRQPEKIVRSHRAFVRTGMFAHESVPPPSRPSHYMLAYGTPVPVQSQRNSIP